MANNTRMTPPNLLNEDGTASMATMLLMSHHAFRRDILRFLRAIPEIKAGASNRAQALREEWEKSYQLALHGHHTMEDSHIFPDIRSKHPELGMALDTLTEQHHKIDPLLEKIDAELDNPEKVEVLLKELKTLLDEHLAYEEAEITPSLRDGKEFPVPVDENMANMYADGFSWSMQGIAPEVLDEVRKMLPEILLQKLPAAQEAFEARSKRVWGTYSVGAATTSIPTDY
jgi:hypothetical protein